MSNIVRSFERVIFDSLCIENFAFNYHLCLFKVPKTLKFCARPFNSDFKTLYFLQTISIKLIKKLFC